MKCLLKCGLIKSGVIGLASIKYLCEIYLSNRIHQTQQIFVKITSFILQK